MESKGISPDDHIDPNSNQEEVKKKLKTRGLAVESLGDTGTCTHPVSQPSVQEVTRTTM